MNITWGGSLRPLEKGKKKKKNCGCNMILACSSNNKLRFRKKQMVHKNMKATDKSILFEKQCAWNEMRPKCARHHYTQQSFWCVNAGSLSRSSSRCHRRATAALCCLVLHSVALLAFAYSTLLVPSLSQQPVPPSCYACSHLILCSYMPRVKAFEGWLLVAARESSSKACYSYLKE